MSRAFMIYGSRTGNTESAAVTIEDPRSNDFVSVANLSAPWVGILEEILW